MATSFLGRSDLPRGLRNNNPGNIKDDGTPWQGMTGSDGTFVIFQDDTWGLRALATDLTNKVKEGNNTIREIISIYAPPSENNTDAYVASVANDTALDPDTVLTLDQPTLHSFMRAIVSHENGSAGDLVPDGDIDQGISMISPSLLQYIQAGAIAVASNPSVTIIGLFAIGGIFYFFWQRKR